MLIKYQISNIKFFLVVGKVEKITNYQLYPIIQL